MATTWLIASAAYRAGHALEATGFPMRRKPLVVSREPSPRASPPGEPTEVRVDARRGRQRQYPVAVNLGPLVASMAVVVALGLAVLALVVAVRAHLRISAVEARYRDLWDARERDLVAVHALGESRTYAKGVIEGLCHTTLTYEEQQALAAACTGKVLS